MDVDTDQDLNGTVEQDVVNDAQGQSGTSGADRLIESLSEPTIPDDIPEFAAGILKGLSGDKLRDAVPLVKEWSSTANKQFQKIHDEYADLKPFKGMNPQEVQEAMEMRQLLTSNPAKAIEILSQQAGLIQAQQEQSSVEEEFSIDDLPNSIKEKLLMASEVPELKEQLGQLLAREQAAVTQIENRQMLDNYNKKLDELQAAADAENLGKFDRDYVTNMVANGNGQISPEAAVKHYFDTIEKALAERLQNHNNAPKVLGGKSIVPVETADVGKLSPKDRKAMIVQMLNAADPELGAI